MSKKQVINDLLSEKKTKTEQLNCFYKIVKSSEV